MSVLIFEVGAVADLNWNPTTSYTTGSMEKKHQIEDQYFVPYTQTSLFT